MKIIHRIQMYFMLRRADKLIQVTRSKSGSKIIDWKPEPEPRINASILVSIALVIALSNLIYQWVGS